MKLTLSALLLTAFISKSFADNCLFHQLSCSNGCANENSDRVVICDKTNTNRCIKKKGSSRDVETTTNSNEYNQFRFDYTGSDRFKLFSENSGDYLALHVTNTWQWRTGNFEATVYDTNYGTLDIFTSACESANGVPYCIARSMCLSGNGVYSTWGHKECWTARKL
ncbi:hypothetical protein BDF21DRAFT_450240 [Thamnidium elegans]|nr:hypothetical protein BDF21DRAFT_450240 [Thamnidium elegans]